MGNGTFRRDTFLWPHHHLRHYFITICVESGVDIPTITDWLGHSDGGALLMKPTAPCAKSTAAVQKVQFKAAVAA